MLNNKSFSGAVLGLFLGMLLPNLGFGQVQYLRGDSGFVAGSVIELEDELYNDFSGLRTNVNIQPQVQLKYDEVVVGSHASDFDITVIFDLRQYSQNGSVLPTRRDTLSLTHSVLSQELVSKSYYTSPDTNVHKVECEIVAISGASYLTKDIMLSVEYVKEEDVLFSTDVSTLFYNDDTSNHELNFFWDYHHGADGYELEWVFLSDEVLIPGDSPQLEKHWKRLFSLVL